MTQIVMPMFLRQEGNALVEQMMQYARMLQARLVDNDRQHKMRFALSAGATDILRVVESLDTLCREVSDIVGGAPALRENAECMRHTMTFRAYCERELAHEAKRKKEARRLAR